MKVKKIMDETTSRYEYNKVHKRYLECKGEIHCSICGYHIGENIDNKWYGKYHDDGKIIRKRYPNWKLVSKNRKQWMKKPIKVGVDIRHKFSGRIYIEFSW